MRRMDRKQLTAVHGSYCSHRFKSSYQKPRKGDEHRDEGDPVRGLSLHGVALSDRMTRILDIFLACVVIIRSGGHVFPL